MTIERQEAEEHERRITDPLLEKIAGRTSAEGRPVRPQEHDRIAGNLDAAIQEWLKHENRCDLVARRTITGHSLTTTHRPSPTSRPVPLAIAIQASLCEALAGMLAAELLDLPATVRARFSDETFSRLHSYTAALLLEFLPFEGPLELILESVPAIRHFLSSIRSLDKNGEVQDRSTALKLHCRRRARTKLRVKSRRSKLDIKLRMDIDEVVRSGESESVIPPQILAFLNQLLEWLQSELPTEM